MDAPTKVGRADTIRVVSPPMNVRVDFLRNLVTQRAVVCREGMFPPTSQRYWLIAHYGQSEMTNNIGTFEPLVTTFLFYLKKAIESNRVHTGVSYFFNGLTSGIQIILGLYFFSV